MKFNIGDRVRRNGYIEPYTRSVMEATGGVYIDTETVGTIIGFTRNGIEVQWDNYPYGCGLHEDKELDIV